MTELLVGAISFAGGLIVGVLNFRVRLENRLTTLETKVDILLTAQSKLEKLT